MCVVKPGCLLAAVLSVLPMCVNAQDTKPTDRLRAVLQHMPAQAVSLSEPLLAVFADPGAVSLASGERVRLSLSSMIRPVEALSMAGADAWGVAAGLPVDEIGSFLAFGRPPKDVTIWGQRLDAERLLGPKLETLGFTPVADMPGIHGNGEPLAPNFAKGSPGDPWRGAAGQASFIAFDNAAIIQSTTPEAVAAVRDAEQSIADIDFVKVALDAIDSVDGDVQVSQAALFSTAAGLDRGLPTGFLTADPKALKDLAATLRAEIETPKPGIPLYFGGFLVDARVDGKPALLITVSYPTCERAAAAASNIVALWQTEEIEGKAMAGRIPGEIATDHIAGHGLCAAIVTITGTTDIDAQHPFDFAAMTLMRGGFPLLRIAL